MGSQPSPLRGLPGPVPGAHQRDQERRKGGRGEAVPSTKLRQAGLWPALQEGQEAPSANISDLPIYGEPLEEATGGRGTAQPTNKQTHWVNTHARKHTYVDPGYVYTQTAVQDTLTPVCTHHLLPPASLCVLFSSALRGLAKLQKHTLSFVTPYSTPTIHTHRLNAESIGTL